MKTMTATTSRIRRSRLAGLAGPAAAAALAIGAIGAIGGGSVAAAPAAHADNGATFHSVMVDCASTQFYRNYDPSSDNFSDPVATYTYGQLVSIRTGDERSGPRGVRGYENMWGWFSRNCLQGYH
jgi:hypothetical protein